MTIARRVRAEVIVTGPSSPFCHAANALRYWGAQGNAIEWRITNLTWLPLVAKEFTGSLTVKDGQEQLTWTDLSSNAVGYASVSIPGFDGRSDQSAQLLHAGTSHNVLMSARAYDVLTSSLMITGLRECATWILGKGTVVWQAESGQFVLSSDRLSRRSLTGLILDETRSARLMQEQLDAYAKLEKEWRLARTSGASTLEDLIHAGDLLHQFFRFIMLLHKSYSDAIATLVAQLFPDVDEGTHLLIEVLPAIFRWQLTTVGLFPAKKDVLELGPELPIPPFTIADDMLGTESRVRALLPRSEELAARVLSRIYVLKEWKFFLSKALHRHFAVVARGQFESELASAGWEIERIREMSFLQLVAKLRGGPDVV